MRRVAPLLLFILILTSDKAPLKAQDIFEIQVYEYPTVLKHKWNLETHINYIARGTKEFEGKVAPTQDVFHLTFELTRGLTDNVELAGYLMLADRPRGGFEFAGWRVRPRFRLPKAWGLPFDFSLSTEVAFPRPQYEANSATLEIRPIIEKTFPRWRLSVNPVVSRALRGLDKDKGFEFEPGVKFAYFLRPRKLNIGVEYYGATGPLTNFLSLGEQQHWIVPSADVFITSDLMMNFGVVFSLTGVRERLIPKMRVGWRF